MANPQNGQLPPNMQQMPPMQNPNGPRIKTEPGMENVGMTQAPYQNPVLAMPNATTAQQRAAQHLQNSYGQRAAASINAIQGAAQPQGGPPGMQLSLQQQQQLAMQQQQQRQMQMQQQQQAQRGGQMPPQAQQNRGPSMTQEQYRQAMAAQAQQKLQNQGVVNGQNPQLPQAPNLQNSQPPSSLTGGQVDGGDDDADSIGLVKQFNENGEEITMGRIDIDGMIRKKILAMGQKMEGGGLMLPLKQASNPSKRQRRVKKSVADDQHDGPGSDDDLKEEDVDEDAINSDLDDPDDGLNEEDDDEDPNSHIMLCMYDKVQRVKNKW
jgi:transcription initiation factor TFIIA large subunit